HVDAAVVRLQQLHPELDPRRRGQAHLPVRHFGLELPLETRGLDPDGVDAGARLRPDPGLLWHDDVAGHWPVLHHRDLQVADHVGDGPHQHRRRCQCQPHYHYLPRHRTLAHHDPPLELISDCREPSRSSRTSRVASSTARWTGSLRPMRSSVRCGSHPTTSTRSIRPPRCRTSPSTDAGSRSCASISGSLAGGTPSKGVSSPRSGSITNTVPGGSPRETASTRIRVS